MSKVSSLSFTVLEEIQSRDEGRVFLIESPETKTKFFQITYNLENQSLFESKMTKMSRVTNYPGISTIFSYTDQPKPTFFIEYPKNGLLEKFLTENDDKDLFDDTKKYINIIGIAYTIQFLHYHNIFISNIIDVYLDENLRPQILIVPKMDDKTDYFITFPQDILTFSYIIYEIITGQKPQTDMQNRPDLTSIKSDWIKQFLKKCWSIYSQQRPNIFDIIKELEVNIKEFGDINEDEVHRYQKEIQQYLSNYSKEVKKSASEKDRDFCFIYGNMLTNGYGVSSSKKEAIKYYKLAAEQGHVSSIFNYAFILDSFEGIFNKKREAVRYFKQATDAGHATSIFHYSLMLYNGEGIQKNKEAAAYYFKISADLGNSNSMFNYAFMLEKGEEIEIDKEEAVIYYKMAADQGNFIAMNSYASMKKKGIGTTKSKKEAAKYFKIAADNGNLSAMFNYAFMLKTGNGIKKNEEEAVKYFKLAADQGNASAAFNYALMIYGGDGVEINKCEASRYFKLAADNGNADSMFNYALMLKNGDGIETNKIEAIHYFKMAANKGNADALNHYRKLTQFMRVSI